MAKKIKLAISIVCVLVGILGFGLGLNNLIHFGIATPENIVGMIAGLLLTTINGIEIMIIEDE